MSIRALVLLALLPATAMAVPDACDGFGRLDHPASSPFAELAVVGDDRYGLLGVATAIGDFDGDGHDDLALGAPGDPTNGPRAGAVHVFYGPLADDGPVSLAEADVVLVGSADQRAGWALSTGGDLDGDGREDLVVGSRPETGAADPGGVAWVVSPYAMSGTQDLDTVATARIAGASPGAELGAAVHLAGDLDGDGLADLVVGAPRADLADRDEGSAWVFFGPVIGEPAPDVVVEGVASGGRIGAAVASADVDGDGLADLLLGAPRDDTLGGSTGAVHLVPGRPVWSATVQPTVTLRGRPGSWAGHALSSAGDVDGDGRTDLWVGGPRWGGGKAGRAWLVPATAWVAEAQLEDVSLGALRGANTFHQLGYSLASGDFDADGEADVLVGAPAAAVDGVRPGAAWAEHGPFDGERTVAGSGGRLSGINDEIYAGFSVAVGDLNGDGFDDAVFGAPRATALDRRGAGLVTVFFGGHDLVDEQTWYADADADGWGATSGGAVACAPPPDHVLRTGDCDDGDDAVHPYALELSCTDPLDRNCDGVVGALDTDGDGTDACAGDCDDTDPAVHPAADERCADGIDNDCDGATDDPSAADAQDWYPDADGDGFGLDVFHVRACEDPGFFADAVPLGGDCDDLRPEVSPAAVERCDLADNDCDGVTDEGDALDAVVFHADLDGDGFGDPGQQTRACAQPAGWLVDASDCDDGDPAVRPGAVEVCNHLDDDCDGSRYLGGPVSPTRHLDVDGQSVGDRFGAAVATVPDLTGDGVPEILVGAPLRDEGNDNGGTAYLIAGAPHRDALDLADRRLDGSPWWHARVVGTWRVGELGAALTGGDYDGDGVGDLAVAMPGYARDGLSRGAVLVWFGPVSGELDPTEADALLTGAEAGERAGQMLATEDVDGDGRDDLLVGAPYQDGAGDRRGAVYLLYGGDRWQHGPLSDTADAWFVGGEDDDELGHAAAMVGDPDGDGFDDLALGAPQAGYLNTGYVALIPGTGARHAGIVPVTASWRGHRTNLQLGTSIAGLGDVDLDGTDDLGFGTPFNEAWLVYGGTDDLGISLRDARSTRFRGRARESAGVVVAGPGDLNGDGFADLVVSAHDSDLPTEGAGGAYVVYGSATLPAELDGDDLESFGRLPEGGTFPTWSAANLDVYEGAHVRGDAEGEHLGRALVMDADFDGDGHLDLLMGGPDQGRGAVAIVRSGPYGLDHTRSPSPALDATKPWWGWDRDVDGQATDTLEGFHACDMHVPMDLSDPTDARRKGVRDPALFTDCNDADPTIYLGAPEIDDDGVDRDCDGWDNVNKLPILDLSMAPVATHQTAVADLVLTDPDAGTSGETPITLSWSWTVDGLPVVGADDTELDGLTWFDRGQTVSVSLYADDTRDVTPTVSASFVVPNAPPELAHVTLLPAPATDADLLSAQTGSIVDHDGDPVTVTCDWQRGPDWASVGAGNALGPCLSSPACAAGDTLRVVCTPDDGLDSGVPVASTPAYIERANLPPDATACTIAPYHGEDLLGLADGLDADGDTLSWTWTWTLTTASGSSVVHGGPLLSHTWFGAEPTEVVLTCTPSDGKDVGAPLDSQPYVHALDGEDGANEAACEWRLEVGPGPGAVEVAAGIYDGVAGWPYLERDQASAAPLEVEVAFGPVRVDLVDRGEDGLGGTPYLLTDLYGGVLASGTIADGERRSLMVACEGSAPFDTADSDVPGCHP
jgi:hypothetical protein